MKKLIAIFALAATAANAAKLCVSHFQSVGYGMSGSEWWLSIDANSNKGLSGAAACGESEVNSGATPNGAGQNCFCRRQNPGGDGPWIYNTRFGSDASCAGLCPEYCGGNAQTYPAFRAMILATPVL
ncbi:MAG: hypothetical protein LBL21_04265 [Rickettsiales bacterium]|jgi:hypothetical protein|nr:hypothetical protein [Rickettsiales bacterium]